VDPQRIAKVTGVLFLITYIAIAALPLYSSVLDDPRYILGAGTDAQVRLGAFLEFIVVIANIGTAVVLYPIVKRQNQVVALGYVATRIVESMIIAVGIFSLLSIVTLRQDLAGSGADSASLVTAGRSLIALHDWTFLFGPGILAGLGNGILLGYLLYRSGLVPRRLATLGLVGGPVVSAFGDRRAIRGLRAALRVVGHRDNPGVRVRAVSRHLSHHQGVQAVSHHHVWRNAPGGDGLSPLCCE
jgi:hypothetical protein